MVYYSYHMDNMGERQQSEFNMSLSYLSRLNGLLWLCNTYSMDLDAHQWFMTLITLYRELSTEMKPEELKKFNGLISDLNGKIARNNKTTSMRGVREIHPVLWEQLHNFELELRKILKSAGLQQKMMEEALNALR